MSAKLSKKSGHERDLRLLLDGFLANGGAGPLEEYLLSNSNLPGPRGNIELAAAFGDVVGEWAQQGQGVDQLWAHCVRMTEESAHEAPVDDPREFLPFCGSVGLGAIGAASVAFCDPALGTLRLLARDSRWRMREAVCFALQRLAVAHRGQTLSALAEWIADGNPLEMRAVAATVAGPAILQDRETAAVALELHREILNQVLMFKDRKSEPFKVLRKGLGYTLSVVVHAIPDKGFAFMAELVERQDRDVDWIVRQNLKKNRLVKYYPEQVKALEARL